MILVSIQCLVYNHEPYLRQCLDGFVMQKTNFKFEAIVHDDVSTDGSAAIIHEYAEKYPDIIKPIFETENQYSKKDGSLMKIMNSACKGKYIALCEGDDYWIDPLKLQKQVDFLEKNLEYTMCCSDAIIKGDFLEYDWSRYSNNQSIPTEDMILGGGLFVQTATLLFRNYLLRNDIYPEFAKKCHVGDYPLQIFAALEGKVFWFAEKQCVYRFEAANSWTKKNNTLELEARLKSLHSEIDMLQGMDLYSHNKYSASFRKRQAYSVYNLLLAHHSNYKVIREEFEDVFMMFNWRQRLDTFFIKMRCPLFVKINNRINKILTNFFNK